MKATDFPNLGPPDYRPHLPRNYQGVRTLKGAEIRRAKEKEATPSKYPRVDALTEGNVVRFSYQHAVEVTELAKRLEQELGEARARIKTLETIGKAARPDDRPRAPREMNEAVAKLEGLSNDEVYERLKRYRCFGMTTRVLP